MLQNKKLRKDKPHNHDFRATRDGVMVADIGFKKQLHALDPELDVVWDWGKEKWEIWRFPGQKDNKLKKMNDKAVHMMTIQTKERNFRELGADILLKLRESDPLRFTLNELCAYFDKIDDNIARAKAKELDDYIDSFSIDKYANVLAAQVPQKIEPKDQKYLLNVPITKKELPIFKPKTTHMIAKVVGGQDA